MARFQNHAVSLALLLPLVELVANREDKFRAGSAIESGFCWRDQLSDFRVLQPYAFADRLFQSVINQIGGWGCNLQTMSTGEWIFLAL